MAAPRLVFAGSPAFAAPTLRTLIGCGHGPVAVLTQPDRPAGRGRRLTASPIRQLADELGLPVLQPVTLKDPAIQQTLRDLAPDLMVVVAYGLLLPPAVLAVPRLGCVNVHASLLPRWRGAAPIQAAILAGDGETGVSIMALDAGLDTGPVYGRRALPILPGETAGELEARLAVLGAGLLGELLEPILTGGLEPTPQPAAGVSYAGRLSKADGWIDWRQDAASIERKLRAMNPWPVAETLLSGQQFRCFRGQVLAGTVGPGPAGEIVAAGPGGIDVRTGAGVLRLTEVQLAGRQRLPAGEFARGRALTGNILGEPAAR